MKTLLLIAFLFPVLAFGQQCQCGSDTLLRESISCDTIKFDNKACLYWNFNCDSSWLTFQSPMNKKKVIFSLGDGLQDMTGKLGYIYAQEYKKKFLIQENVISGCCTPPEFHLFDKTSGEIRMTLGRIIFYSEEKALPFIVSITNSDDDSKRDYPSLTIYNVDKGKKYLLPLPSGQIKKALKEMDEIYPEYLFDIRELTGTVLKLTYSLRKPKNETDNPVKTIIIDLAKYRS